MHGSINVSEVMRAQQLKQQPRHNDWKPKRQPDEATYKANRIITGKIHGTILQCQQGRISQRIASQRIMELETSLR